MPADRLLPTDEAREVVGLARDYARRELLPRASQEEEASRFPRDVFRALGDLGLMAMPYPERWGGAGLPFEIYLQALEEIAGAWATVGVGLSVHVMSCWALVTHGTEAQRERWLPEMLGGHQLGGYCLSEVDAGSDPAAMRCRATRTRAGFVIDGAKAWVTHAGEADFYTVFARTADAGRTAEDRAGTERERAFSCFLSPGRAAGLSTGVLERKMGLTGSPTAVVQFDGVELDFDRLVGREGQGLPIALAALDSGRLGIAAVCVGLAQACLDEAVAYARERETFGRPIIAHQGLGFLLADMVSAVESARAVMLEAARRRDHGLPFSRQASVAKLVASEAAMRVATDAVQVLGGAGYTKDFRLERMMREAKVMQIFEGTSQIQRLVIARHLARA